MKKLITISREFGSGGRELGCRLADQLGAAYYDREIITEISKRTRLSQEYIQGIMDNRPHISFPITVARSFSMPGSEVSLQMELQSSRPRKRLSRKWQTGPTVCW